jgi:hypothetical protein
MNKPSKSQANQSPVAPQNQSYEFAFAIVVGGGSARRKNWHPGSYLYSYGSSLMVHLHKNEATPTGNFTSHEDINYSPSIEDLCSMDWIEI